MNVIDYKIRLDPLIIVLEIFKDLVAELIGNSTHIQPTV